MALMQVAAMAGTIARKRFISAVSALGEGENRLSIRGAVPVPYPTKRLRCSRKLHECPRLPRHRPFGHGPPKTHLPLLPVATSVDSPTPQTAVMVTLRVIIRPRRHCCSCRPESCRIQSLGGVFGLGRGDYSALPVVKALWRVADCQCIWRRARSVSSFGKTCQRRR
jgi:hypothetical protein